MLEQLFINFLGPNLAPIFGFILFIGIIAPLSVAASVCISLGAAKIIDSI